MNDELKMQHPGLEEKLVLTLVTEILASKEHLGTTVMVAAIKREDAVLDALRLHEPLETQKRLACGLLVGGRTAWSRINNASWRCLRLQTVPGNGACLRHCPSEGQCRGAGALGRLSPKVTLQERKSERGGSFHEFCFMLAKNKERRHNRATPAGHQHMTTLHTSRCHSAPA